MKLFKAGKSSLSIQLGIERKVNLILKIQARSHFSLPSKIIDDYTICVSSFSHIRHEKKKKFLLNLEIFSRFFFLSQHLLHFYVILMRIYVDVPYRIFKEPQISSKNSWAKIAWAQVISSIFMIFTIDHNHDYKNVQFEYKLQREDIYEPFFITCFLGIT